MIITNNSILLLDKEANEFRTFDMPNINPMPNIPFYHMFAEKIGEGQYYFKEFMKRIYGNRLSKYIFAIIVPDDTSKLESIFINEFFVNSGACKAVAQMPMALGLCRERAYISISKSMRNVILEYIRDREVVVRRVYDVNTADPRAVLEDAGKIHIDVEYKDIPIYINNFENNMTEYLNFGRVVNTKMFMEIISQVDVEKL